jgi:hypothetical protein
MKKSHNFKLIDGTFSAADAENVLSALISSKINFHSMESFSSKERFSKEAKHHEKRFTELKEARKYLDFIIKEAKDNNKELIIDSSITIQWE